MTEVPLIPPKVTLDAAADQTLAAVREMRAEIGDLCGYDDQLLALGRTLAGVLREQFPAVPALGRVTLAVAVSLESIRRAGEARGAALSPLELAAVASLAAEQLDREVN